MGSLRFTHLDEDGSGYVEGFCLVGKEVFEEEGGAFERTVITTATSYGLKTQDLVVIYHTLPTGVKVYRVGPNISANTDLIYKAILDDVSLGKDEDEEPPRTLKEVVYIGGKEALQAGDNITIDADDESETITIGAEATSIADKSVGIDALSDEVDARLLPPKLGTMGQVLAVNADADDTEWVDPQSGPPGRDGVDGRDGRDGMDSTVPGPPGRDGRDGADSVVPGPPGRDGRDGIDGTSLTINYRKVAKNGTDWTDLVTGSNYNADYIYRITAIVNSDHTETVSIKGGDLALASGNSGLKMFIRNNARSCDIRLNKGKIQGRLNDSATCTFTVMWAPIAITTIS